MSVVRWLVSSGDWIAAREQLPGTPRERAIAWRRIGDSD